MPMDLRRIYHATILSQEKNFTKAANKLFITQPALSRSITKLETELDIKIFNRDPGEVTLTDIGKTFIERAKTLLQHSEDIRHEMDSIHDGSLENLAFGITPYPAAALLNPLIKHTIKEHKDIKIRAEVSSLEDLIQQLDEENIEFFITNSMWISLGQKYKVSSISEIKVSLYVRKGHPILSDNINGIKETSELLRYPLVGVTLSPSRFRNFKMALGIPTSSSFQLSVACNDFSLLKSITLSSDSILIAPPLAIDQDNCKDAFRKIEFTEELAYLENSNIDICIVKLAKNVLSPLAQETKDYLQNFPEKQ